MAWRKCTNGSCSRAGWCKRISYSSGDDIYRDFECGTFNNWEHYVRNKAREIYERENPQNAFDKSNETEYENNNRESGVWEDDDTDTGTGTSGGEGDTSVANRFLQLLSGCIRRSENQGLAAIGEDGEVHIYPGPYVFQDAPRDGVSSAGSVDSEPAIGATIERILETLGYPDNNAQDAAVEDTEG